MTGVHVVQISHPYMLLVGWIPQSPWMDSIETAVSHFY